MTPTESKILEFVGKEFLHGETAGLTVQTRLLELNIVDSLGIMELLAFIERDLGTTIPVEDIGPDSLQDVSTIAALVDQKRGTSPRPHDEH